MPLYNLPRRPEPCNKTRPFIFPVHRPAVALTANVRSHAERRSVMGAGIWFWIIYVLVFLLGGFFGIIFAIWIKDGLIAVTLWGGRGMPALDQSRVMGCTVDSSVHITVCARL